MPGSCRTATVASRGDIAALRVVDAMGQSTMDHQTVAKVAELARLELDAAHLERYAAQLRAILDHFEVLRAVDTEGVEPSVYAVDLVGRTREDVVIASPSRAELLANAPNAREGFFVVPRVLE